MLQADQLAEVAELAGGFIHEVKNHVSTLNLNLQLLADDFADPQTPRERRAKQRLDRVRNQCEKLVEVSNDFLRFVRSQNPKTAPTRLEDVVGELVDFFAPTARGRTSTSACTPPPACRPCPWTGSCSSRPCSTWC
jgi:two-component system sensor histidine kinase HydH